MYEEVTAEPNPTSVLYVMDCLKPTTGIHWPSTTQNS